VSEEALRLSHHCVKVLLREFGNLSLDDGKRCLVHSNKIFCRFKGILHVYF